jgi:hypothetical protein
MAHFDDNTDEALTTSSQVHAAPAQDHKVRIYQGNPPGEHDIFLGYQAAKELVQKLYIGINAAEIGPISLAWNNTPDGQFLTITRSGDPYATISQADAKLLAAELNQAMRPVTWRDRLV